MFQRDYVLRQIQQLIQVLELVILKRTQNKSVDAHDILNGALKEIFGVGIDDISELPVEDLIGLCSIGTHFNADKAVALAEILESEAEFRLTMDGEVGLDTASLYRERAHALYTTALNTSGAALPLDIYDRLESLLKL